MSRDGKSGCDEVGPASAKTPTQLSGDAEAGPPKKAARQTAAAHDGREAVCLLETGSDNNDDAVRRGSAGQRAGRAVGSADDPVNPC